MTDATLRQALAYARHGWPVFPCLPGQKIPATRHGYLEATTDEQQITEWFGRSSRWNLAIATGHPGPDVLDVDQHGPAGNGFAAFAKLRHAGLTDGAAAYVRTPAGGMHAYFTGTDQHNGRLPSHHLDFRSHGGYILAPPSAIDGKPYELIARPGANGTLDWTAATQPARTSVSAAPPPTAPSSRPRPDPLGPMGRQPARGKPQRRPVLGCQPRPRHQPGRRPQPAGGRRPPSRPRRQGDNPHPRLRPSNQPQPHRPT